MTRELLRQVRVLDPVSQTDSITDVLLLDGQIEAIAPNIDPIPPGTHCRDGHGLVLGPGLVDLYSHAGEPGFEARETLASLIQAAIAGGFTRLLLLPSTKPPVDNPATLALLRSRIQNLQTGQTGLQVDFWGALTLGNQGQQMTELGELALAGVVGFGDGQPLPEPLLLERLLVYLQPLQKPICLWPWHATLGRLGVIREGPDAIRLGLPGVPVLAESTALATLVECIAVRGTPVHCMRLASARGVELIAAAKARGLPITASTTWMHLLGNTGAIANYDPNWHLAPPLGTPADQKALLAGLREGVIDAIAIDHRAYTYEEKTVAFAQAPPGAVGLELALPLLWQRLVTSGHCSALELWAALSSSPLKCLGEQPQAIAPRPMALTLFDPQKSWVVQASTLKSPARNTPWWHQELTGRVLQTWFPTALPDRPVSGRSPLSDSRARTVSPPGQ